MPAKLTRQHFQFFADCIKDSIDRSFAPGGQQSLFSAADRAVIVKLAEYTADRMTATNSRFDRQRFLSACGV